MTTTKNTTECHHYVLRAGFLAMALWRSWANTKVRIGRWAGCYQKQGRYVGVQPHVWRYFFGAKEGAMHTTSQGDRWFDAPQRVMGERTKPIMPSNSFYLCDHDHSNEMEWCDETGDYVKGFLYTHSDNCIDLSVESNLDDLVSAYYAWVDELASADGERSEWTQKVIDQANSGEVSDSEIGFTFSNVESFLKACGKAQQAFERAEKAVGRKAVPEHLYGSRTLITGSITELKTEWTDYGERTSISIRDDRGFDFIVTAPKAIKEEGQEGVRISLEATVKEWNKVEGLAYGQRPSKGVIL